MVVTMTSAQMSSPCNMIVSSAILSTALIADVDSLDVY
jgi:hypothetical protein